MSFYDDMTRNGLVRPINGRILGGVCAGLGRRFGMEPWPARLLFILVLMILPGSQLLVYPVLWILMPSEVRYPPYPPYAPPAAGQYAPPPGQYAPPAGQYPPPYAPAGQAPAAPPAGPPAPEPTPSTPS